MGGSIGDLAGPIINPIGWGLAKAGDPINQMGQTGINNIFSGKPLMTPANGNPGNTAGDTLANIALSQFNQTQPLRNNLIGQYNNVLSGNPGSSTIFSGMYAPARAGIEDQYSNARNMITEGSDARGGALTSGLQNAMLGRARAVSDTGSNIIQNTANNAQNYSLGLGSNAIQGLGMAGNLQQQAANAQFQQQAAKGQGLGSMLGMGIGYGLGGPAGGMAGGKAGGSMGAGAGGSK